MRHRHIVIVGGGLAGLSAACYARAAGFRTTLLEHNQALGGVCTSWTRGHYTVDGCIHWLTGGPFDTLYQELGIFPNVATRVIDTFVVHRDLATGREIRFGRDLDALSRDLERLAPEDAVAIRDIVSGARALASIEPNLDAPEVTGLGHTLASFWKLQSKVGVLWRFKKSLRLWLAENVRSPVLAKVLGRVMPLDAPAVTLLFVLGYLERGWLSRPMGGTEHFRDALVETHRRLGGQFRLFATVDEILVRAGRVHGVRLSDGTMLEADAVVSTSSTPETVLRLLGGRYGAKQMQDRLARWKVIDPIVLASFGVRTPLAGEPGMLLVDGIEPLDVGGRPSEHLYLRVCNDDPSFAPEGHAVLQAMLPTEYDFWATLSGRYAAEKEDLAKRLLVRLERCFPGLGASVEMTDLATPLTYWNMARSWRGAFEGWLPNEEGIYGHLKQTLPGLAGLYLAGQWVEPGGGVPTALGSGRRAIQLLCKAEQRAFVASPAQVSPPAPVANAALERARPVLVLYATREGQTRRIAEHVGDVLRSHGYATDVRDAKTDPPLSLQAYGSAILAGSVHVLRHERELTSFVRRHKEELEALPTAFLSVSLSEAGAEDREKAPAEREKHRAGVDAMLRAFFEETGWHADSVRPVAGKLAFSEYGAPKRLAMRGISALAGGPTDVSRDYDFTDWRALDRFVEGLCEESRDLAPRIAQPQRRSSTLSGQ